MRRSRPAQRRTVHLLVALALLASGPVHSQAPAGAQNALAGARVFGAKGCANCHAINGIGRQVGPDLGAGRLGSYYGMAAGFWNHFSVMVETMRGQGLRPPRLSPREMEDLIAFMASVDAFEPPGDAERGSAIFRDKRCVRCHQVGGVGGAVGPNLDALGREGPLRIATAMWNHGPAMSATMEGFGIARPTFTGRELRDLLAFLRRESPQSQAGPMYVLPGRAGVGARLMSDRSCLECHTVRGRGAGLAPDLASRSRALTLAEFAAMLWNKAPTMLAMMRSRGLEVPKLEPSDMSDIVAYLYSVRYFRSEGNPENGRRLLGSRGCTACHRPGGSAGSLRRVTSLRTPAAVIAALWSHASLVGDGASTEAWPPITAEEMADIVSVFIQAGGTQ